MKNIANKYFQILNYQDVFEGKIESSKGIIYKSCYKTVYEGTIEGNLLLTTALEIIKEIFECWPMNKVMLRKDDIIFIGDNYYISKGTSFEKISLRE